MTTSAPFLRKACATTWNPAEWRGMLMDMDLRRVRSTCPRAAVLHGFPR